MLILLLFLKQLLFLEDTHKEKSKLAIVLLLNNNYYKRFGASLSLFSFFPLFLPSLPPHFTVQLTYHIFISLPVLLQYDC